MCRDSRGLAIIRSANDRRVAACSAEADFAVEHQSRLRGASPNDRPHLAAPHLRTTSVYRLDGAWKRFTHSLLATMEVNHFGGRPDLYKKIAGATPKRERPPAAMLSGMPSGVREKVLKVAAAAGGPPTFGSHRQVTLSTSVPTRRLGSCSARDPSPRQTPDQRPLREPNDCGFRANQHGIDASSHPT